VKAALDTCVIYPPVLRALLLRVARAGLYQPLWSERILEEWARATGDAARLSRGNGGAEAGAGKPSASAG
jgi:hypothetical protein